MLGRHQRAHPWLVGQQLRRIGQRAFAFLLKILKGVYGILQVGGDFLLFVLPHPAAHHQKAGGG